MSQELPTSSLAPTPFSTDPTSARLGGLGAGTSGTDRQKVAQLAQEFESFFVLQMIRQMRESMLDDESHEGLGADTMTSTVDVELSRQLASTGGIGLSKVLQEAIERQALGTRSSASQADGATGVDAASASVPVAAVASPAGYAVSSPSSLTVGAGHADELAVPMPLASKVTSSYGWRTDPFNGMPHFHAGVDIGAAYGKAVPAAGNGEVVFAGAQGGYGNTVVIEHAGGVRTRYAHLSEIDVAEGSRVEAGSMIGRVGSSGRSTGPHLHFEVLQDGHPVNPEAAATRYAGLLKFGGVVADSNYSQPSNPGVAVGVDDEDSGQ